MLAAVTRSPGVMVLGDVPDPSPPGPEDVILRPEVVGVCGSDLHLYSGDTGALSGARSFFPRVQGHELSATVEKTGDGCPGGVRPGDRVAVWPLRGCGRCYPCRVGRANACVSLELVGIHRDGGLAELLRVPVSQVWREPAARVGAENVAWGGPGDLLAAARRWARGPPGPPRVIDTTGDPGALALATEMVCAAGRVVVVGMSAAPAPLRSGIFPEKEIDVAGSSSPAGLVKVLVVINGGFS